jgi:hypothetical protein
MTTAQFVLKSTELFTKKRVEFFAFALHSHSVS